MVIDTSALIAILLREPEREPFLNSILDADVRLMSAVSLTEAGMVLEGKRGSTAEHELEAFVARSAIVVVAVDGDLARRALAAWRKYGRGRHPAALNFGDCFSYALAESTGEPLLAKGNDFARTDLTLCPQQKDELN